MNRPDHLVLQSHRRSRSVPLARAARARRNARPTEIGRPKNAEQSRYLALSLFRNESRQSGLDVFARQVGEMPLNQTLIDPLLYRRVVQLWFQLFCNSIQLKTVAPGERFQKVANCHT